jgi:hypothetical protein
VRKPVESYRLYPIDSTISGDRAIGKAIDEFKETVTAIVKLARPNLKLRNDLWLNSNPSEARGTGGLDDATGLTGTRRSHNSPPLKRRTLPLVNRRNGRERAVPWRRWRSW